MPPWSWQTPVAIEPVKSLSLTAAASLIVAAPVPVLPVDQPLVPANALASRLLPAVQSVAVTEATLPVDAALMPGPTAYQPVELANVLPSRLPPGVRLMQDKLNLVTEPINDAFHACSTTLSTRKCGHKGAVRALLEFAASSFNDDEMLSLLHMAVVLKRVDVVAVVLEVGAKLAVCFDVYWPTARGTHICMPQAVLLCRQPIDLTIALLRALRGAGLRFDLPGTIFDQKPSCGISLAYKAVETHESPSVLAFLAECGAGLDVVDSLGQTPLWNACRLGKLALVQFLHQEGASLHTKGQRSVHGWMFNETGSGDIVDTRTSLKFSPLHMASLHGHLDVVRYLCLQGSIFADMLTLDGCSPLHLACEAGHTECVRWLHQQGADIERAYCGKLPFQVAFRNGHAGVAAYLRSCGVNECLGRGRLPDGLLRGYDVNVDGSSGKDRAENCPLPKPKRQSKRAFREGKRKKRITPMKAQAERRTC